MQLEFLLQEIWQVFKWQEVISELRPLLCCEMIADGSNVHNAQPVSNGEGVVTRSFRITAGARV